MEKTLMIKNLAHNALKYYIRSFPVSKGKGRILSWLWKPFSFDHYKRQTVLRQANICMNCDLTQFIQRHLYFYGSYEEQQCAYWLKRANTAQVVFDIGANVGLYSLLAAAENPNADIHAFEPTPELVGVLDGNIQLNGFQNISVNPVAVGKTSREGTLHRCTGSDGSNEGMNFVTAESTQDAGLPVKIITLDDYCRQHQIRHVDLAKMDIEGGEFEALLGAQELLRAHAIDCIFLEFSEWAANRSGHSTDAIKRLLLKYDYHIYRLGAGGLTTVQEGETHSSSNVIALPGKMNVL